MILDSVPEVRALSNDQKLQLIEELWSELGISLDEIEYPISSSDIRLAEESFSESASRGDSGTPWEMIRKTAQR
ncbi:MAG: hypothetical protein KDN19_05705 [Verrucomicrobiae bacterium]|nr:hypothetical protein [Verrucomicrobiae bacterium]